MVIITPTDPSVTRALGLRNSFGCAVRMAFPHPRRSCGRDEAVAMGSSDMVADPELLRAAVARLLIASKFNASIQVSGPEGVGGVGASL